MRSSYKNIYYPLNICIFRHSICIFRHELIKMTLLCVLHIKGICESFDIENLAVTSGRSVSASDR